MYVFLRVVNFVVDKDVNVGFTNDFTGVEAPFYERRKWARKRTCSIDCRF